jgi:N-acetyl-anhydromuramyl-L-alanine amidase AmpD
MPIMQQRKTTQTSTPTASEKASGQAKGAAGKPKAPLTPGVFPGLGIVDETKTFAKLSAGKRKGKPQGAVLHRTESPSMKSTRNGYQTRMDKGSHIGAHYLIGQDGSTSLTVPTDERVYHARGNKDAEFKKEKPNTNYVGIENVGMATNLDKKKPVRKQVEGLDLPPGMRKRLLGMDDKGLKREVRDTAYEVHTDITAPQKRSNWNLVRALSTEHGFDASKDVHAHEDVDHKTLGEAEPIKEFTDGMTTYPAVLDSLKAKADKLAADPKADPKQLAQMQTMLKQQRSALAAVAVDGSENESTLMAAEKIVETDGPATKREAERVRFYDSFWKDRSAVDAMTTPAPSPAAIKPAATP